MGEPKPPQFWRRLQYLVSTPVYAAILVEPKPPQFWRLLQIYLKKKADGAVEHLAEAEGPDGPLSPRSAIAAVPGRRLSNCPRQGRA